MIVGFSGFGFPKAHGAAFGLLAYQSTWLRVHYGPEFLCALLNEQPMGFYPPDTLVHEAQRRGIEVLAAGRQRERGRSARSSAGGANGDPRRRRVRIGLGYVRGVRAEEVEALVAARERGGPFRSLGRPRVARRAPARAVARAARLGGRVRLRWSAAAAGAATRCGSSASPPGAGAGQRVRGGTQLALPLELPAAPALRRARRRGRR